MAKPKIFRPHPYQRDCLDALATARSKGKKKALVVMATGLGKTMVSAFEIKRLLELAPGRVLYLCHNNDILRQARKTYESVLGKSRTYGYFHGTEKHMHHVDVLFASFQTMATWRETFRQGEFRYVIIDEIHHGHAATFRPTIEYFEPDFMVGLTATPERTDGLDITELLGRPVYELGLFKALALRYLCDVDYRVMTDEIQMAGVLETPIGKLSIASLNRSVFVPKRDEEIARIIQEKTAEVKKPRAMIFCASIKHAERMAKLMPHAVILHSGLKDKEKGTRLEQFRSGEANTILTVDMLNEGIDVPEANVIVFLRSTSSRMVFLQQLGRGLRKAHRKLKVLVLDFVANCERFEMIDQLQQGVRQALKSSSAKAESEVYGSLATLTLTLDGSKFDERVWELTRIVGEVRENFLAKNSYTKEVLSKQLLAKAKEMGRTPTAPEVDADPNMASTTAFFKVFNAKWNDVLREVGLPLTRRMDYTKAELTAQLQAKAKTLGRTPYGWEVDNDPNMARVSTFQRVFNLLKWNDVLREVGLPLTRRMDYTKAELTAQLQAKAKTLGRTPKETEVEADSGMASVSCFLKTFDLPKWNDVIRAVGLTPTQPMHTKKMLTEQLLAKAQELGRAPYAVEVEQDPAMPARGTFMRVFSTTKWNEILKEAGLTPLRRKQRTYTKEMLTKQLQAKAQELGRAPYVAEVKSDPGMASFTTFRDVFNAKWDVILKEAGLTPNKQ